MSNNPYNNPYVKYHPLRTTAMATITEVTEPTEVNLTTEEMVTQGIIKQAITMIHTSPVMVATAETNDNIATIVRRTPLIVVLVWVQPAVLVACYRCVLGDRA